MVYRISAHPIPWWFSRQKSLAKILIHLCLPRNKSWIKVGSNFLDRVEFQIYCLSRHTEFLLNYTDFNVKVCRSKRLLDDKFSKISFYKSFQKKSSIIYGIPTISQTIFSQPASFSNDIFPTTFSQSTFSQSTLSQFKTTNSQPDSFPTRHFRNQTFSQSTYSQPDIFPTKTTISQYFLKLKKWQFPNVEKKYSVSLISMRELIHHHVMIRGEFVYILTRVNGVASASDLEKPSNIWRY